MVRVAYDHALQILGSSFWFPVSYLLVLKSVRQQRKVWAAPGNDGYELWKCSGRWERKQQPSCLVLHLLFRENVAEISETFARSLFQVDSRHPTESSRALFGTFADQIAGRFGSWSWNQNCGHSITDPFAEIAAGSSCRLLACKVALRGISWKHFRTSIRPNSASCKFPDVPELHLLRQMVAWFAGFG